jgi:hypothetical protein
MTTTVTLDLSVPMSGETGNHLRSSVPSYRQDLPGTDQRDFQSLVMTPLACCHCSRILGVTQMSFAPQP